MEKIFYIYDGKSRDEVNQVLVAGGKVKMIAAAGNNDNTFIEAYVVVELPPQTN